MIFFIIVQWNNLCLIWRDFLYYWIKFSRMRGSGSRSASGSEIYERLPADTGSLGEDLEDRLRISCSDEDVDCGDDIYLLNQRNGSEHLVKPSQLKHQHNKRSSKGQRPPPPPGKHVCSYSIRKQTANFVCILIKPPTTKNNPIYIFRQLNFLI